MTEREETPLGEMDFELIANEISAADTDPDPARRLDDVLLAEQQRLSATKRKMSLFSRIPVTLTLEVASAEITLAELMSVDNDSVIELDKLAGDSLDVKINGILFGKAEVVVVNDKYGLRLIEFNNKDLGELIL
ncbi:flagellar motor switch protein FliN [Rouxiella chamberiensis]|uniref:flagellar motor switch protein FliN n=1 Tax=Rouxiella chamberiensis TaxID=1513468 RepID=UPI0005D3EACA|nr:flagellar motor switch protein FliN [Rouxiella chamberiensis]